MPSVLLPEYGTTPPSSEKWHRPEKTTHDLPWANIKTIDLSIFDQPGGKQQLAEELRDAVHNTGFFSIINIGFSPDEVQRQYDIAQQYFALDPEDKGRPEYRCDFTQGNYFGYRAVSDCEHI